MNVRLVLFVTLSCSMVCSHGATEAPQPTSPPATRADFKPVTAKVVDRESNAPVTRFSYYYRYDAPGRAGPGNDDWTPGTSPTGTFEIRVPPSCRLSVGVKALDYIGGYPLIHEFVIKSTEANRQVVVKLRRGITVQGIVRDEQTKKPIAGVTVAPVIHLLPIWVPDEERKVTTGKDGRYEVHGVDPDLGVSAFHPGYVRELPFPTGEKVGAHHDVFLKRGSAVSGVVLDTDGKPVDGVTVIDLNGHEARTTREGTFRLANAVLDLGLGFHKEGWIAKKVDSKVIRQDLREKGMVVVVLERLIPLRGQVLTPDGRTVEAFTVAAGPGKLPDQSDSTRLDVKDPSGRFTLGLEKAGTTWVGVYAGRFAPWEGSIEATRDGPAMTIRLSKGVSAVGKLIIPDELRKDIKVRLAPRRDKSEIGGLPAMPFSEELAVRTTTAAGDGTFRFEHLRPDRYALRISGRSFPDKALAVDVPEAGIDLGPIRIEVPRRGRIVGRVFQPKSKGGGVWAFANGGVYSPNIKDDERGPIGTAGITFQADESGRFTAENVPAGLVTVGFPYQVFDVIQSYDWAALVVEGQTTVVRPFDPDAKRELPIELVIGDGSPGQVSSGTGFAAQRKVENVTSTMRLFARSSRPSRKPMFRLELVPRSREPLAFAEPDWHDLDDHQRIVLPDVGPGKYQLRLFDWLGLRRLDSGPLVEQEIVVPRTAPAVRVPLGAGCVTGKVPVKVDFDRAAEIIAVSRRDGATIRRARCDGAGNFCVRYLSPGPCTLLIRDPKTGFSRVDDVAVSAGVTDLGERPLRPGGAVRGTIAFPRPCPIPDEVIATGPLGETLRFRFEVYSSFDQFEFANLWPGRWSFAVLSGGVEVATGQAQIAATEKVAITLAPGH